MSDQEPLFDLQPTENPLVWRLPVTSGVCAGPASMEPFMYGGLGLAAGIKAMQSAVERPLIWASAQYLSFAGLGDEVEFTVEVPSNGRTVAHTRVTGRVGDREVITAVASYGARSDQPSVQWSHAPQLPPPEECVRVELYPKQGPKAKLIDRLEVRLLPQAVESRDRGEASDTGKISMWMRIDDPVDVDPGVLALFADFVPAGIAMVMGRSGGGSSLDNTLRIVRIVPTTWVLCEFDAHAVANGMAHGDIHLYAETGELMAVGSQSCLQRFFA